MLDDVEARLAPFADNGLITEGAAATAQTVRRRQRD